MFFKVVHENMYTLNKWLPWPWHVRMLPVAWGPAVARYSHFLHHLQLASDNFSHTMAENVALVQWRNSKLSKSGLMFMCDGMVVVSCVT